MDYKLCKDKVQITFACHCISRAIITGILYLFYYYKKNAKCTMVWRDL